MAPNRREKTTGEMLEEIPPHHEIAETAQVPKLKTKLGCAISRGSGARTQPQQTGKGFQLSACNPSEETAAPPDFSGWFTAANTLH